MKFQLKDMNYNPIHRRFMFLTLFGLYLLPTVSYSQSRSDIRIYYDNIVDIGLGDFGLITGADKENIYFICVRNLKTEQATIEDKIPVVHFYNNSATAAAKRIKNFTFNEYTVVLYQCPLLNNFRWVSKYFNKVAYNDAQLQTYLDNGISDNVWSINHGALSVNEILQDGVFVIRADAGLDIDKGMPVISVAGFITGIFAEKQKGTLIKAIDLQAIANKMYDYSDCRYFTMIQYGQTGTRCEINKEYTKDTARSAVRERQSKKKQVIGYGINGNIMGGPSTTSGSGNGAAAFSVGMSIHFNIDPQNRTRLSLKPRYGHYNEQSSDGIWKAPGGNFKVINSAYNFLEAPIMLEQEFYRSSKFSMSIAIGYSPAYLLNQSLMLNNAATNSNTKYSVSETGSNLMHKLVAELYFFETDFYRLGLVYQNVLSKYPHQNYQLPIGASLYKPFDQRSSWFLGVEAAFRFRGVWGLPKAR